MRAAYAHCEALAKSHYENFPVASRLMPAALRPHVAAVYAFATLWVASKQIGNVKPNSRAHSLRLSGLSSSYR